MSEQTGPIVVIGGEGCDKCTRTTAILDRAGVDYQYVDAATLTADAIEQLREQGMTQLPIVATPTGSWTGMRYDLIQKLIAEAGR